MARKAQDKPLFIPQQKSKKVKLSVDVASNLMDDLKLYTQFLIENGHDSKFDEMVETILESVRKDKIFLHWLNTKKQGFQSQETATQKIKKVPTKEKISGAEAQA